MAGGNETIPAVLTLTEAVALLRLPEEPGAEREAEEFLRHLRRLREADESNAVSARQTTLTARGERPA